MHEEVTCVDEEGIKNWAPCVENLLAFWYEVQSCNFLYKKIPKKIWSLMLKILLAFLYYKVAISPKNKIKFRHLVVLIGQISWLQPIATWGNGIQLCDTEHRNHVAIT
jgi:hypothetical protein